jgi:hypothetical protein
MESVLLISTGRSCVVMGDLGRKLSECSTGANSEPLHGTVASLWAWPLAQVQDSRLAESHVLGASIAVLYCMCRQNVWFGAFWLVAALCDPHES